MRTDEPKSKWPPRLTPRWVVGGAVLSAILVVYFASTPIKEAYLIGRLQGAKTVSEQVAAFRLINRWGGCYGIWHCWEPYSVDLLDEHGEVMPVSAEIEYPSAVVIGFPTGRTVRVELLESGNVGQLLGE